jgi:hypothetical protein
MPRNAGVKTVSIADPEVSLQTNTTGEFSNIIDIQVPQGETWTFPSSESHGLEMYVYTHESTTVSGTQTVTLSNNIINSPARRDVDTSAAETQITGPRSLVVWDEDTSSGIQTGVDSVDYDANEFDYSETNGGNLEYYYLPGDSSQVEFRKYNAVEEDYDKVFQTSMRAFHESDVYNKNSRITFPDSFSLREKEHLKVSVKTDVDLARWLNFDASNPYTPGSVDTWSYSYFKLPVIKRSMH